MKKLFLSSIIVLGVCSFATAQSTDAKASKKLTTAPSISAAPTPQKAAVATTNVKENPDGTVDSRTNDLKSTTDVKANTPTSADVQAAKKKEVKKTAPAKKSKGQ